jgi:hypothetical protein
MRVLMPLAPLTAAPAARAQNPWLAGRIASRTLRQIRRLDAAHWFAKGDDAYRHDRPRRAYRLRGIAPGVDGAAAFLLGGGSPGDGVVAFQMPITFTLGDTTLQVTTAENVARTHAAGYAWHTWLSNDGESRATWRTLLDQCVDGVMTARPTGFERLLRSHDVPEACR